MSARFLHVDHLSIGNVRVIRAATVAPGPGFNIVYGGNGSGKTSFLEAIHLLGTGRSFRTRRRRELVTLGCDGLVVFARVRSASGANHSIGLQKEGSGTAIRIDGEDVRAASALARILPALFIGADCGRLLEEPDRRRGLLDWAVFHVEPGFLPVLQRFQRILKQRNAVLRAGRSGPGLRTWDKSYAQAAEQVEEIRGRHIEALVEFMGAFTSELLNLPIAMEYRRGWSDEMTLEQELEAGRETDLRLGYTRPGPHRADVHFEVHGLSVRRVLSRGESKLLALGFALAQAAFVHRATSEAPVLLLDDVGAELDDTSQSKLVSSLGRLGAQAFITTVEEQVERWSPIRVGENTASSMFHVEQGEIQQVV